MRGAAAADSVEPHISGSDDFHLLEKLSEFREDRDNWNAKVKKYLTERNEINRQVKELITEVQNQILLMMKK